MLLRRGIDTSEQLRLFLDPPHRLPYDPLRLSSMDQALQRLYRAVNQNEQVGIFGDFDVDGMTGTAIIFQGLEAFGLQAIPYLPLRSEEGHGLSTLAIDRLKSQGTTLLITVDTGVTSADEVAYAKSQGIDVIITDHHLPHASLPAAAASIDPMMPGGSYPFPSLCGAGLAFKLIQGLYQFCGQPWDRSLLELAALGTIADLVPLVDENRYLVHEGLKGLAETQRPGLQALYRRAGVEGGPLSTETISFQVTPRLNSPGRLGHAMDSFRLLTTKSSTEAEELADKLEALNQERRLLSQEAINSADAQVREMGPIDKLPALLIVSGPGISRGVAGLVAGRLAENYHRPAVALSVEEEFVVGSRRSIPEFNLFEAFSECEDLFVRFGGHAQAAGFTVEKGKLGLLEERLISWAEKALQTDVLRPVLEVDAQVEFAELAGDFPDWVSSLEPFGAANRQPVFATNGVQVVEMRRVGRDSQHLNLKLSQRDHQWTAMAFNQSEKWVEGTSKIDLVYTLNRDRWRGVERLNLKVLDFYPSQN